MRTWQVEVLGRARAQVVQQLAAVHLDHVARRIEHRDDQAARQVLVAAVAVDADALQLGPQLVAGDAAALGQTQAQAAVRIAELEAADGLGVGDAARLQVAQRFGALLQGLVVVVDDLREQGLLVGIERQLRTPNIWNERMRHTERCASTLCSVRSSLRASAALRFFAGPGAASPSGAAKPS